MYLKKTALLLTLSAFLTAAVLPLGTAAAVAPADAGLSLQVSPSPIVLTIKPAEKKTTELKIYNAGTNTENLRVSLQDFKVDKSNGRVTLEPGPPPEVRNWISFSDTDFSVKSGESFTQLVTVNPPPSAGFSYSFAIVINRQVPTRVVTGQRAVQGSVAVFSLLNIDRPGAVRKLAIESLQTEHKYYEYLPARLTLKLRNNGNSLLLPAGNVFIQRQSTSNSPISVLAINPNALYLLPGVSRDYQIAWNDGLPAYVTTQAVANAAPQRHLEWNWRNSHFRIGRYIAHVVVIYNDGQRDVPLQSDVKFWVLPWRIMLGALVGLLVLLIGVAAIIRVIFGMVKRKRPKNRA